VLRSSKNLVVHSAAMLLERPVSPEGVLSGLQAPASPSNSSSSNSSSDTIPLQHHDLSAEASGSPEQNQNRPKRCKISREQLAILIKSFDDEPLPNFDQRQGLAKMLGMTPRSVQIWFQNRRQRLKPMLPKSRSDSPGADSSRSHGMGAHAAHDAELQYDQKHYGMPNLAAAASLCNGGYHYDMPMMSRSMPQLQQLHSAATSGGSRGSFMNGYDVMEPFAATKALLSAGYHPPSMPSLNQRLGQLPPNGSQPPTAGSAGASAGDGGASGGGSPSDASAKAADGLLLLLACADGSSGAERAGAERAGAEGASCSA